MLTHTIVGQSSNTIISQHLFLVIAVYALLVLAARRSWLKTQEVPLVTGAMLFWAVAWILQPVIPLVRTRYPQLAEAIPLSLLMVAPIVVAMIVGVVFVMKKNREVTESKTGNEVVTKKLAKRKR
jgi:hypothetical protein